MVKAKDLYRGLGGGGLGLGVPVVSYAPRPMLVDTLLSLVIITGVFKMLAAASIKDGCSASIPRQEHQMFVTRRARRGRKERNLQSESTAVVAGMICPDRTEKIRPRC